MYLGTIGTVANEITETHATLYLRLYLGPGGRYPYERLFSDMRAHLDAGRIVTVISVPGFLMASGDPKCKDGLRPWYADGRNYITPQDCIRQVNGTKGLRIESRRRKPA